MTASDDPLALLRRAQRSFDPFGIAESLWEVQRAWLRHPAELTERLGRLGLGLLELQQYSMRRMLGQDAAPPQTPVSRDERFQDPAWTQNLWLDLLKEHYLLYTHWLEDAVFEAPDSDERTRRRAAFWVRQALDAYAPSNFFWTNPAALARWLETGGRSASDGLRRLMEDAAAGDIRMVDEHAFGVGRNIATTPGAVVFRNELFELIGGPVRYTLATSGHILGVISPPVDPPKRRYWTGEAAGQQDPEQWLGSLEKVPGSWWEDWDAWLRSQCGELVDAPTLGNESHPVLMAAPGSYVLER